MSTLIEEIETVPTVRTRFAQFPARLKLACTAEHVVYARRLARLWGVTVPEALRRMIEQAAEQAQVAEPAD